MLFVTTKEFLRRFGMDSLEQLPETGRFMPVQSGNEQEAEAAAEEVTEEEIKAESADESERLQIPAGNLPENQEE